MAVIFGIILLLIASSVATTSSGGCDRTYTSHSGTIRSPGSPNYPNNANCTYVIKGSPRTRAVVFTFDSFRTEEKHDVLHIGNDKFYGAISMGKEFNYTFSNSFTLRFTTDGSQSYSGFIIKYKLLSERCPKGFYGDNCTYDCSNGCQPDTCRSQDGVCDCKPGWQGIKCDEECISGRFGTNCTEECHCRGRTCNASTGICAFGCQLGWTGKFCSVNLEKQPAEAKFYCFKIRKQNTLMLRVNQRGTRYRTVTAYNKDGTESPGCNKTHFNHFEIDGMATLKVSQQKNKGFTPTCGEEMVSDDRVTWKFKFQEFPMTSSAYDVLFEVTCDFKNADTLTRLVTSNSEKPSDKTTTLSETKISVSLDVIDPFSDQPLTTVKLGQQVKLQLKLDNGDDFGVTAIAPYNCSASTLDGVNTVFFKDNNGCTTEDSQIFFNATDLTKWQSELFETFTFQGYDKINFQCQFHVCFTEEQKFCRDTCAHSKKRKSRKIHRRRRHQNSEKYEERKELGTTVKVVA